MYVRGFVPGPACFNPILPFSLLLLAILMRCMSCRCRQQRHGLLSWKISLASSTPSPKMAAKARMQIEHRCHKKLTVAVRLWHLILKCRKLWVVHLLMIMTKRKPIKYIFSFIILRERVFIRLVELHVGVLNVALKMGNIIIL